jgi:hypothetical protein
MKTKTKQVTRNRKLAPKKVVRKTRPAPMHTRRKQGLSQHQREILVRVWPRISDKTKIVELPDTQTTVSYAHPSGETATTTLVWYTFSHGPRVYGYYDDANDVCYLGKIIE